MTKLIDKLVIQAIYEQDGQDIIKLTGVTVRTNTIPLFDHALETVQVLC